MDPLTIYIHVGVRNRDYSMSNFATRRSCKCLDLFASMIILQLCRWHFLNLRTQKFAHLSVPHPSYLFLSPFTPLLPLDAGKPLDIFISNLFEHSHEHPWVHYWQVTPTPPFTHTLRTHSLLPLPPLPCISLHPRLFWEPSAAPIRPLFS